MVIADGIKDLIDGIKLYVDNTISGINLLTMELATIVSHGTSGYSIKLNGKVYNNIMTMNGLSFANGDAVRLMCKKTGDKYIEIIIMGKVTS